jgi:RNA polymerase primary sigma factor
MRTIADQGRTIRVPVRTFERIKSVTRTMRQLVQQRGRKPTTEESAESILPLNTLQDIL